MSTSDAVAKGTVAPAKQKVVVIGLDGSSWDLVNQMLAAGHLPNMKKIQGTGVATTLRSTHPAHSAPAWTTFATGVPPTEHGCLDFLVVRDDIDDLDIIDSTKITQETIYETMVRHGKTPILINLPNTFPPKLKSNITITSLMTRGDQYIYPESLKEKYPDLQKYRLSPNAKLRAKDQFEPYVNDVVQLEQERIAGAKQLFEHEPWDFFFYLSSGTDWVSHVVYDKAVREQYQPAWKVWDVMDDFIGWVMERLDANTTLFIMSDHGFRVYDKIFYMNRWLEQQGLATTTDGSGSFQQEHTKLSQEVGKVQRKRAQFKVGKSMRRALAAVPLLESFAKWFYANIVKPYLPINVTVNLKLDLAKTQVAFPRGSMASMLYVNDAERFTHGIVPANERRALTLKLKHDLAELKDKAGQPIVGNVFTAQELYGDHVAPKAPDLFLEADQYYLSGSLHSSSLFENATKNYHDGNGMLLAYGAKVAARTIPENNILNLPPTLLHALGLPVQKHFAGETIDLFDPQWSQTNPVIAESHAEHFAAKQLIADLDI